MIDLWLCQKVETLYFGSIIVILRGDFLENRIIFAKSAQNLVAKPVGNCPATIIFLNKFSKICENLKNFTGSLAM